MKNTNEPAIKSAINSLKAGDDPETIVRFIYHLGETEGMLKMARVAEEEMVNLYSQTQIQQDKEEPKWLRDLKTGAGNG